MTKYLIGVQPTGKLHIGNFLGCIRKGLELQKDPDNEVTFLIANYHSLTTDSYSDITEQELKKLGCKKIVKQTPEYTELFYKLCCKVPLSILKKMPQYKDKSSKTENDLGLLLYPVLMTADIIMNDPDFIIVGKDQVPHIELANDIAKKYGIEKTYKYIFGDVDKVYSLKDSSKKMSKSDNENTILYLFDEDYKEKIKGAVTDEQGIKNLSELGKFFNVNYEDFNEDRLAFKLSLGQAIENYFSNSIKYPNIQLTKYSKFYLIDKKYDSKILCALGQVRVGIFKLFAIEKASNNTMELNRMYNSDHDIDLSDISSSEFLNDNHLDLITDYGNYKIEIINE